MKIVQSTRLPNIEPGQRRMAGYCWFSWLLNMSLNSMLDK